MFDSDKMLKIRTVEESSVFAVGVGAAVLLGSAIALFYVKNIIAAVLILMLPLTVCVVAYFALRVFKNAVMVNIIDYKGIRNEHFGDVVCQLEWNEIGDFGVTEVRHGIFKGKYIYMSRIYIPAQIKRDIVNNYDPRICIVLPYTSRVCDAVRDASGEKIDIV